MADKKISELQQLAAADANQTDEIIINDVNAGGGGVTVTKRITLGALKTALGALDGTSAGGFTPAYLNFPSAEGTQVNLGSEQRQAKGVNDTTVSAGGEVGSGTTEDPYGVQIVNVTDSVDVPDGATSAVVIFTATEKFRQNKVNQHEDVRCAVFYGLTVGSEKFYSRQGVFRSLKGSSEGDDYINTTEMYEVSVTAGATLSLGVDSRAIRFWNNIITSINPGTFTVIFGTGTVTRSSTFTTGADDVSGISAVDEAYNQGQNLRDKIVKYTSVIDTYLNDSSTGYDDLALLREYKDDLFALQNSQDAYQTILQQLDTIASNISAVIGSYQFGFEADAGVPESRSSLL